MRRLAAGTHQHDDALRERRAFVFKQLVGAPDLLLEGVHRLLHDVRAGGVKRIARLARLEERVGILRRAAQHRFVRRQPARAVLGDEPVVNQRPQIRLVQHLDFLDLVRRAEAVEEMHERNPRAQRGRLRDEREIRRLLHAGRAEHGPAGRAAGHDVAVIAENGKRVRGDSAGGHVKDRRQQFAGDLEHIGNHQQQSLRRRERRGDGAGLQHAVDRAHRAALALQFDDAGDGPPKIAFALGCPLVAPLGHRRGRSYGINRHDLIEAVGDMGDGFIAVQRQFFSRAHVDKNFKVVSTPKWPLRRRNSNGLAHRRRL